MEVGRVDNAVNRTWGEVNGKGLNKLGELLMEVRDDLRKQSATVRRPVVAERNRRAHARAKRSTAAA